MKETRMQRARRQHKELMNNVIEARQYGSEDNWKIEVTYSSGAKRTFKNEPSWFEEYIENAWSIPQNDFTVYAASHDYIKANYSPVELEAPVEEVQEAPESVEVEEVETPIELVSIKLSANRDENYSTHTITTTAKFELTYSDGSTETIETISNNADIQIPSNDIAYFMHTSKHRWNANCYWFTEEVYTATPETKKIFKEVSTPVEKVSESYQVSTVEEAWNIANKLFKGDYEYSTEYSNRAGYSVYMSTRSNCNDHISDLNSRLEVNIGTTSINIYIA